MTQTSSESTQIFEETQPQILGEKPLENDPLLKEDYSVIELFSKAKNNEFPKRFFLVGRKLKSLTSILHFYKSLRNFSLNDYKKNVEFTCKFCKQVHLAPMNDFSNLYKHLACHKEYFEWSKLYKDRYKKVCFFLI